MVKVILITEDFTLHNAFFHYIDSVSIYQNMDELIHQINCDDTALKYLVIVDNRFPFFESVKVEKALMRRDINAKFVALQISKIAYNILGYYHYYQVKFEGVRSNIMNSIIYFIDNAWYFYKSSQLNIIKISKLEVDIMKFSIFEENIKAVAKRMNMPVKKIYHLRELLYKRLGLPNVNQAFLYILNHYPGNNFNRKILEIEKHTT